MAHQTAGDVLSIISSGYVGIGTTSPSSKLDVNGDIQIPDGSELRMDNYGTIASSGDQTIYNNY